MRAIDADAVIELLEPFADAFTDTEVLSAYIDTLQLISNAPTIDIPTWIPCSERLPDKNGWYLLAQAFEWGIEYEAGVWEDGAWWINDNSHVTVAWRPIEPYKEKNDDQ